MLSAILLCALAQVHATVSLDPVPTCQTCDALTARVAALEAQLARATRSTPSTTGSGCLTVINYPDEPPRRVRLIEVSPPVRTITYAAPAVRYVAPLGEALPTLSAWAPGSYTVVQRPGLFGGRLFGGRFSSVSACGPGGCP